MKQVEDLKCDRKTLLIEDRNLKENINYLLKKIKHLRYKICKLKKKIKKANLRKQNLKEYLEKKVAEYCQKKGEYRKIVDEKFKLTNEIPERILIQEPTKVTNGEKSITKKKIKTNFSISFMKFYK